MAHVTDPPGAKEHMKVAVWFRCNRMKAVTRLIRFTRSIINLLTTGSRAFTGTERHTERVCNQNLFTRVRCMSLCVPHLRYTAQRFYSFTAHGSHDLWCHQSNLWVERLKTSRSSASTDQTDKRNEQDKHTLLRGGGEETTNPGSVSINILHWGFFWPQCQNMVIF